MEQRRPVVTGLGIISAAGTNTAAVWDSIQHGRSGLGPLTLFPSNRYGHVPVGQVRADVDQLAGRVRGSRSDKLAWIAAREAVANARLSSTGSLRIGVCLGATVGGMLGTEKFIADLLHHRRANYGVLRFHECAASADLLARQLGATGPVLTFSTACSGGAMAISVAGELITNGEADVVVAGGCDSLCRLTLNGFGSLLLLDPKGCRPFDADRAGISLGEGAGMLVLEAAETAAARGATILAELTGWGASCDAYHATAPQPDGAGALAAMRQALTRAGLQPGDISYVSAHGTGTRDNDLMEGRALRQLFGDSLPAVSSTKAVFGHTLGASGAIKAVVSVLALQHQTLPPNPGFGKVDPEIGVEPVREFHPATVEYVLSNSFGFGGNNVALVFSKPATTTAARPAFAPCRIAVVGVGTSDGDFAAEISAARRRRLGRLQQMTLVAAKRCLPAQFDAGRTCVAIGTELGSLNEATAFVENMILKSEAEPQPQRFTNSVHNALAAQVAIEFGLKGLNSTPTCQEVSFEAALWHAVQELRAGTATLALAGVADELNPYAVAAAKRWQLPAMSEGAVVFALATEPLPAKPLAYLTSVRLGRDVEVPVGMEVVGGSALGFKLALEKIQAGCPQVAVFTTAANGQKALCVLER
jgi:3-oxoacyl-(acyl-carrier-protein) synthase